MSLDLVVTSMSSDAHTWNLVYLQLLIEELGYRVTNLGACVPDPELTAACRARRPDLIVISSVNGHGCHDGLRVIRALRGCPELAATPVVIGGKLGVADAPDQGLTDRLVAAGFDAVFLGPDAVPSFRSFVESLTFKETGAAS